MATSALSDPAANPIPVRDDVYALEETTKLEATEIEANPELSVVRRAQNGDQQAFGALFQLHKKRVYSVCLQMTKNAADAEDLTQEAFLQVFRNIGSFRGDSAFSTWLHRIAVNTVLMKLRRRSSAPMLSLDEPVSPDSPNLKRDVSQEDLNLNGAIDRIALRRAIAELPQGCRQIFDLHEVKGYQHHEIAELLQCSVGNSKSQLHKAKTRMRDLLFPKRRTAPRAGRTRTIAARLPETERAGLSSSFSAAVQ